MAPVVVRIERLHSVHCRAVIEDMESAARVLAHVIRAKECRAQRGMTASNGCHVTRTSPASIAESIIEKRNGRRS